MPQSWGPAPRRQRAGLAGGRVHLEGHRLYARSGYTYADRPPRNAAEYYEHTDAELDLLKRVYFANRGVWEVNVWAGPAVAVAAREDVDHYLAVLEEFVGELAA
jgi:hypothetical protein